MSTTNDTYEGSVFLAQPKRFAADTANAVGGVLLGFGRGIHRMSKRMQVSRMQSVLNAMSDAELKTIDLERRDIPQRARFLVDYEYDGL